MNNKTVHEILREMTSLLSDISTTPRLDARLLLAHALGASQEYLLAHDDDILSEEEWGCVHVYLGRRQAGEPVSKIVGHTEFWGLPLRVTQDVLDPRPDTETLVETALKYYKNAFPSQILDLGTGSGALLLVLLTEFPNAVGVGVDVSPQALLIAQENATRVCVASRATFLESNWTEKLEKKPYDLIVSNPPYIAFSETPQLHKTVLDYDPHAALFSGPTGLEAYDILARTLALFCHENTLVLLEIGTTQAQAVQKIFEAQGWQLLETVKDLAGHDRCLVFRMYAIAP